ncbi:Kelch repeat-containing protein [Paenibacillus sp. HW567]|uniref:Kelch repeat-containing protein n=1 Tax=Paenibacillus sp. HW567 TaxID=1034769 RepID=UPI00035EF81C|nr:kelch repeat-containing protein [Paenibacillus sp. HW567]
MKYLKSVVLVIFLCLVLNPNFASADEAQWVTKNPMSEGVTNMRVITVNGDMYRIGGYTSDSTKVESSDKVYKYEPINDAWIPKASMHVKREYFAIAESGGKIYVFGGQQHTNKFTVALNSVEEYDPVTNVWTVKQDMPTGRMGMSAATVNGKIYVISGIVGENTLTSPVVEEYNPITNSWTKKKDIPTRRWTYGIGVYSNKIYIIGGYNYGTTKTDKIEIYDPNLDTWTTSSVVSPTLNIEPRSVTYKDNIYLIGVGGSFLFSPATETLSSLPSIPAPKYVDGAGIGILNGKLYSVGGSSVSKNVYEYAIEKVENPGPDPQPEPSGDRAILTITLTTGLEKEYDLSAEEIKAFLTWYDERDAGKGLAKYAIDKHSNNKGPFISRKEYIIFDKILTFSVDEYTAKE